MAGPPGEAAAAGRAGISGPPGFPPEEHSGGVAAAHQSRYLVGVKPIDSPGHMGFWGDPQQDPGLPIPIIWQKKRRKQLQALGVLNGQKKCPAFFFCGKNIS